MSWEGSEEPAPETVKLCKLIADSQGEVLQKLHETQGETLRELIRSQQQSQHDLLERLTTSFSKGLEEVLNRQNKAADEEKSEDEAEARRKRITMEDRDGNNVLDAYQVLYTAVRDGNLTQVNKFREAKLREAEPDVFCKVITCDHETALHIAIINNQWNVGKELLKHMTDEALKIKDKYGATALHAAALHGNIGAAKEIVERYPRLTQMRDEYGRIPLEIAIVHFSEGQKETVQYLYTETKHEEPEGPFSGAYGAELLCSAIENNFYDLALTLVKRFPELATAPTLGSRGVGGLKVLMDRPFAFKSGANLTWWQRFIYSLIRVDRSSREYPKIKEVKISKGTTKDEEDIENPSETSKAKKAPSPEDKKEIGMVKKFILGYIMPYYARAPLVRRLYSQKVIHEQALELVNHLVKHIKQIIPTGQDVTSYLNRNDIMKTAIEYGITEFVAVCLDEYPHLIWENFKGLTMIQMAIQERDENILNLILETSGDDKGYLVSREDDEGNNILHYAAKIAPSAKLDLVSGSALQIQREVQWYKGVEAIVHSDYRYQRNKNDETPKFVFTREHKDLVEKGGQWIKDTCASCMVVSTLISTVAFAAVFTIPGGLVGDTNDPNVGLPVFLSKWLIIVFALGDGIALFSSIASVLMFLAIMTSRNSEEDFYKSLPHKFIIGLLNLFFCITGIAIAFFAAVTLTAGKKYWWAPIPMATFGLITVVLFAWLEFPLFAEMVRCTYYPSVFRNKKKHVIANKKKTARSTKPIDPKKER